MRHVTIFIVAFLAASSSFSGANGGKIQIIDENESNLEALAQIVCETKKGSEKQIRFSHTIKELNEFFKTLPAGHKLAGCGKKYGDSLGQLERVLALGNEAPCSEEKVELLQQFHRRYVSNVRKFQEERKANNWKAPNLVQLFFMHYATKISTLCERDAKRVVEQVAGRFDSKSDAETEKVLAQMTELLGVGDLSRGYDSVYLMWNLIDKLPIKQSKKFSKYLSEEGLVRLTARMRDGDHVRDLQRICATTLQPIYSRSLLSVLKLVDMGYYPEDETLVKEVATSAPLERLFVMTQVCELLRPIKVLTDTSLAPGQVVLVPKGDNPPASIQENLQVSEKLAQSKGWERSKVVSVEDLQSLTSKVKQNVKRRDQAIKMIFKAIIGRAKSKLQAKLSSLFLASQQGDSLEPAALESDLNEVDESSLTALVADESRALRKKRKSVFEYIMMPLSAVYYCIALVFSGIILAVGFTFNGLKKLFGKSDAPLPAPQY